MCITYSVSSCKLAFQSSSSQVKKVNNYEVRVTFQGTEHEL